jgi:hypothetical protein
VEKIHSDNEETYLELMTDGPTELLLVSKFGGFVEVKTIIN